MESNKCLEYIDEFSKNTYKNSLDYGQQIFEIVKDFYSNGLIPNVKPKENEWTIFSAVILQNENNFKLVTYASGTKSLPNKNYKNRDHVIYDSHAEILACRAFKMFLKKCLIFNLGRRIANKNINSKDYLNFTNFLSLEEINNFNEHEEFFNIFDFSNSQSKIKLKEKIYFHLYISEFPCGDSSIFPTVYDNNLDKNQTGSKTLCEVLKYIKTNDYFKLNHDNSIGQFRSKSMRSDTNKENISFSLSCSDKLLFKNILGIQGKYLSTIINNIYFSTIVISVNDNCFQENEIKKSTLRGISLLRRFNLENLIFKNLCNKLVFNEPVIFLVNNNLIYSAKKSEKNVVSFSSYWYYGKFIITKIDPTTGLKQGTSISKINIDKCGVDLNKFEMFRQYLKILEIYSNWEEIKFRNIKFDKTIEKINELINKNVCISINDLKSGFLNLNFKYLRNKYNLVKYLDIEDFLEFKLLL